MDKLHGAALVAVIALVTLALRVAPFLLFREDRPTPPLLEKLGQALPFAIMGMLVVYCLKDVVFTAQPFGIPEILACAVVAGLHIWKRNTLLSIGGGTAVYMLMVNLM